MAKGARKKTKWVSLSLTSSTSTGAPAEHDAASKSFRGTKTVVLEGANRLNLHKDSCPENVDSKDVSIVHSSDRRLSWNSSRQQSTEGSTGQPYSNGGHTHAPRNYSSHFKSHYSRNSYYHSGSSRKPYYNSYNGNGTHRDSFNDQYTADAKNEKNGTVIINEDEYTKITTPRQDVLFKKGYLSRPKKHTTSLTNGTENGVATGSSSVNGGTTDGSDVATASGSVSTAESVTSDSAYLTDSHLLDYPAPLPYFGYIDQSGVLVMNGFAVDNSGFPYMNGGQTYIYPTNYHCQSSFNEDGEIEEANVDEGGLAAADDDKIRATHTFDDGGMVEAVPDTLQENADVCLLKDQTSLNSISDDSGQNVVDGDDDLADLNQQVPQQTMLSPIANSFDYAQFYNGFYYPNCMVAPFPMVGNEMYCDQFGGLIEEEHARQQGFRKRKGRYRNWDEYPPEYFPDEMMDTVYQYPNVFCIPETEGPDSTEVPVDSFNFDPTIPSVIQAASTDASATADNSNDSTNELSSNQQSDINFASLTSPVPINLPKPADRSQNQKIVSKVPGRQKTQAQKNRKKDLIESTRAFAEQNIDLTRPAGLLRSPEAQKNNESSEWRTVRHGKEITVEEDREVRFVDTRNQTNINLAKEVSESPSNVKLFYDDCKEQSVAHCDSTTTVSEDTKRSKKETSGRKGKKTAKGKGKKSKKIGLSLQQKGFEVIEPEFPVSKVSNEIELEESTDAVDEPNNTENEEDVERSEHEILEVEHEIEGSLSLNEPPAAGCTMDSENDEDHDVECLEETFRDIKLSDLQIENTDHIADRQKEVTDINSKECQTPQNDSIVEIISQNNQEDIDTPKDDMLHEVPSELAEETEQTSLTMTCSQACAENMDLSENKLMENFNLPFNPTEHSSPCEAVEYEHEDDEDQQACKHFSNEEYFENFDSGVQSPAALTSASSDSKERKSSASSFGSQEIQLTDAVTKWLSETLSNKRLEELFVLPEDPILLHRIHQFNVLNFDESLVLSSDTYSSSSCDEAEDCVDSDYMSDVQVKPRFDEQQKTELEKDELAKQTANGHRSVDVGNHSNHKQKRCIIM